MAWSSGFHLAELAKGPDWGRQGMHIFARKVLETIERHQLLARNSRLLVGLSGGPDSVALLAALADLRSSFSLELSAAHFNHRLRGVESDRDEEFVRSLCRRMQVPLSVDSCDTRGHGSESGENLEDFARRQRYEFFFKLAHTEECAVATGHTLNDQAETFLMKLIRGAGPAGLSGIYPLRVNRVQTPRGPFAVVVVRPLLRHTRAEVLGYLAEKKQDYRIDESNRDLSFDRNWVRRELIPLLEENLNPALLESLARSAGLFREIEDFLLAESERSFDRCRVAEAEDSRLDILEMNKLPPILQKEVIRKAIRECKGDLRDITLRHIQDVLGLTQNCSGKEVHLPHGIKVQREYETLCFTLRSAPDPFCYELTVPGEVYVGEVKKYVVARTRQVQAKKMKGIWLKVPVSRIKVRNRRPGDRFCVSSSSKKLKELFQARRIPKSHRDKLLILEVENQIIWLEGFPAHPAYQASPGEEGAVRIEVHDETFRSVEASKQVKEGQ